MSHGTEGVSQRTCDGLGSLSTMTSDARDDARDEVVSIIHDIIEGRRSWYDLNYFGFYVSRTPEAWIIDAPLEVSIPVGIQEIIEGAERLRPRPEKVQEWAQFLIVSGIWEFSETVREREANELLEALWDFAFADFESGYNRISTLKA